MRVCVSERALWTSVSSKLLLTLNTCVAVQPLFDRSRRSGLRLLEVAPSKLQRIHPPL